MFGFTFTILSGSPTVAQTFTWKKGSNSVNQAGVYGNLGIASPANVPGARVDAATWTDAIGNLWLYGGFGYDNFGLTGNLSDLWKYDIGNNLWTWVKGDSMRNKVAVYGIQGQAAAANSPGGRQDGIGWTDASGNFWMFGGSQFSDVWKYNPLNNQWTWVSGGQTMNQPAVYGIQGLPSALNTPGVRYSPTYAADPTGNLWLFGGNGVLNSDLWKFDIGLSQWTWIKGTSQQTVNGVYGVQGQASPTVYPGGRMAGCMWIDGGFVWMFGGNGMDATNTATSSVYLNDVWKYNISSGQWMWVKGSNAGNQNAVASAMETFSANNTPGARVGSLGFKDTQGKFWIFCGIGYTTANSGYLNDLWKYDPTLNQWAWMQGSQLTLQNGIYGTQGVPSIFNMPGSRIQTSGWIDNSNNIWLSGGYGMPQAGQWDYLNDLWKYNNCSSQGFTLSSSSPALCVGSSATLSATGAATYTWSTSQLGNSIVVAPVTNTVYQVTATFTNGCVQTYPILQNVNPLPLITANNSSICSGGSATLVASGAITYSWNGVASTFSLVVSPSSSTIYTVSGTDNNNCQNTALVQVSVVALPVLSVTSTPSLICAGESLSLSASGAQSYTWANGSQGNPIVLNPVGSNTFMVSGVNAEACVAHYNFTLNVADCLGLLTETVEPAEKPMVLPNPTHDKFEIYTRQACNITLYDAIGRIVLYEEVEKSQTLYAQGLLPGLYSYILCDKQGRLMGTGKIIFE